MNRPKSMTPIEHTIMTLVLLTLFGLFLWAAEADAQETQLTYCQNNQGEVVIVTNFTCPPGYWRI